MRIQTIARLFAVTISTAMACRAHGQAAGANTFYNVMSYGAVADGNAKCSDAISKAIDAASAKGGGTVYFPAGTYLTGPITLKSNITLYVDAGATIKFSTDFNDYLPMRPSRYEGIELNNFSPLIYANKATNIGIVGHGTLDGQGQAWYGAGRARGGGAASGDMAKWAEEFKKANQSHLDADPEWFYRRELTNYAFRRAPFIQPYECTNVLIEGVTITNSPFWTITPCYCEFVNIRGVTILNPTVSPNTDGINPDSCKNVHISDCYINAGDDCITIKSGKDAEGRRIGRPAENYTITNCTMAAGHGGLSIGSEMSGGVKNITMSNCVFDGTDRGIRLKSTRGRGGTVEDIRVSNIVMRNIIHEALYLDMFYTRTNPEPVSDRTPIFRNVHFSAITGDCKTNAVWIRGLGEMPVENITFADIQINAPTGIQIADAKGIQFRDTIINTEKGPALTARTTDGLDIANLRTNKPHADAPLIDLGSVKNVFVHSNMAVKDTDTFLTVDEASADQVTMEANQLKQAKTVMKKVASAAANAAAPGPAQP